MQHLNALLHAVYLDNGVVLILAHKLYLEILCAGDQGYLIRRHALISQLLLGTAILVDDALVTDRQDLQELHRQLLICHIQTFTCIMMITTRLTEPCKWTATGRFNAAYRLSRCS